MLDSSNHGLVSGPGYMSMLEKMMRNPETRSLLYPYLPEPMRNPETFEWMLNNPEYRAQLEQVLSQQQASVGRCCGSDLRGGYELRHSWDATALPVRVWLHSCGRWWWKA